MGKTHAYEHDAKRLDELDSLRGLAATSVVLGHFKLLWLGDRMLGSPEISKRVFKVLLLHF